MSRIIGVRFRNAGRSYYFDPGDNEVRMGDHVIVESAGSIEYGTVSIPPIEMDDEKLKKPLAPVIRVANEEDEKIISENKEKEKESFKIAKEKIREHGLDMKLVQTEYSFERNKILFYFTAEGRVDFRNLVKDLASVFRTRIELRQIGVRDETRVLGGLGICGRELCCKSFLTDFAPVSIKMAKEQNLSLNPTKISGVCGRLMCCLTNEAETYEYLNKQMPAKGDGAVTPDGEEGVVTALNVLRQKVAVIFEENDSKEIREYDVADLTFIPKKKRLAMEKEKSEAAEAAKAAEEEAAASEADKEEEIRELISIPAEEKPLEEKPAERQEKQREKRFDKKDKQREARSEDSGKGQRGREHYKKGNDKKPKPQFKEGKKEKKEFSKEGKPFRDQKPRKEHRDNKKDGRHGHKDLSKRNGGYRPYQHKSDGDDK